MTSTQGDKNVLHPMTITDRVDLAPVDTAPIEREAVDTAPVDTARAEMKRIVLEPAVGETARRQTPSPRGTEVTASSLAARPKQRPWIPAMIMGLICSLGCIALTAQALTGDGSVDPTASSSADDGAGIVPVVALTSVGLACLRWRPASFSKPVRPVTGQLALTLAVGAAALCATILFRPQVDPSGPVLSLALVGCYLALWGFRSLALLRTVTLLSLLTWPPAANYLHDVVRSSLEQPSALIYNRLAHLPLVGVADEPWRLFSAELHRGALVVIATAILAVGANRWRVSARTVIDLTATVTAALVIHHVVILSAGIDQYRPSDATRLATNPILELAISAVAVLVLGLVRARRDHRLTSIEARQRAAAERKGAAVLEARDPVIFANDRIAAGPAVSAMLLTTISPLVALVLVV